ncbi:hypothetical protein ACHQM5_013560 [Ranunculus cassubicifolius]
MEDSVTESEILKMNGNGKRVEEEKAREVVIIDGEKDDFEPSGGLLGNFISNLVSPKAKDNEEKVNGGDGDGKRKREDEVIGNGDVEIENGSAGNGSVFNNLISNIFHKNEGENGGENGVGEENKKVKVDEGEGKGEGGGIINNIVSKLPTSLPEAAAPPTDEASILIHSIIHD